MLKRKRIITLFLSVSMVFSTVNGILANAENTEAKMELNEAEEIQNETELDPEDEAEDKLPEGYDQAVIDEINNNIMNTADWASDTADSTGQTEDIQNADYGIMLMSTDSSVPEEFKIAPVNSPFNEYNNTNESVSLTTGASNFEKTLISLPGRNGLDLEVSIKYNSDEAVITKSEYDSEALVRNSNFNSFAIGWSFGFTTILKQKNRYGYSSDTSIRFSDGSSYKINNDNNNLTADKVLSLQGYKLSDMTLTRKADTKEYVLSYPNGVKEYFDGTYGNIVKREDRFGNAITFEYTDLDYFRGSFTDYYFYPSFYSATLHALSKITDSVGRTINISYDMIQTPNGKNVSKIEFKIADTVYAELNLDRKKSYNGEIDVLSSIVDAEYMKTDFLYTENLAFINYEDYESGYVHAVNGSAFLLTQINLPTGGHINYEYSKERRSSGQKVWYDVFKVKTRNDSEDDVIKYDYVGDRSGYPTSYINTSTEYITNQSVQYHTIVKHNNLTTIHTFDYMHNRIREQSYDEEASVNKYIFSRGNAKWNVVVNNKIYRLDTENKSIYIYAQLDEDSDPVFFEPCNLDETITISAVKTAGSKIYVFYRTGSGTSASPYVYKAKSFDTVQKKWSDGGEYTLQYNYTGDFTPNLNKMYYANNKFYAYCIRSYADSSRIFYHLVYDPKLPVGSRWSMLETGMRFINSVTFFGLIGNKSYYYDNKHIIEYDLINNKVVRKGWEINIKDGFINDGDIYINTNNGIYKYDFELGTCTVDYSYPIPYWKYIAVTGSDGRAYLFSKDYDETSSWLCIYRLDPEADEVWQPVSYRLFDNDNFSVIAGYNTAYITTENNDGFEKVNMSLYAATKSRTRIDNTYNTYNQITEVKKTGLDNGGKKVISMESKTYADGKSAVLNETDVLGNVTAYEYSSSDYYIPTKITQYSGTDNALVTVNTLSEDKTKILSSVTSYDDRSIKTEYTYNTAYPGNVMTETASETKNGATQILTEKAYTYDTKGGQVIQAKNKNIVTNSSSFEPGPAEDFTVSYTYDNMGRMLSQTNAEGQKTSYTYNKNGWLLKTVNPDGTFVNKTYLISQSKNKVTTSYNNLYYTYDYFDGLGRLEKQTEKNDDDAETLLKTYDYTGSRLNGITDANGSRTSYEYDSYDRITEVTNYDADYNNVYTQYAAYDDYNLSKTVSAGGKGKTSYYDIAGRLIKEEQGTQAGLNSMSYEYDYMGNVIKTTNAAGGTVTNTYNDLGQLLSVTNQLGQTTYYEYDARGNISKTTYSGGNVTQYEYDKAGRLQKTTDVLGNSEYYAYDKNNNLIAYRDKKGQTAVCIYDNMNRLTAKTAGNLSFGYTYDSLGNQLTMTDSTGTTEYTYTYNNRLAGIITPDNKTISYTYDNAGNITELNDYAGNSFEYEYDGANRLTGITKGGSAAAAYEYTAAGELARVTTPEGKMSYTYDNASRLLTQTNTLADNTQINNYSYTYDILGNQIQKTDTSNDSTKTTEYAYDSLSRLTAVTEPDNTVTSYTFDTGNNIMTKNIVHPSDYEYSFTQNGTDYTVSSLSAHSFTYSYNRANQLMTETESIAGTSDNYSGYIEITKSYAYDENGNTLSKTIGGQTDESVVQYTYNELNQLTSYTAADGTVTSYGYDGTGMRVTKTQGDKTHRFYWDRGYISNESKNNSFTAANYAGVQGVFAREENGTASYFFKNGHGDVVSRVSGGTVTNTYDYDAYGAEKQPDTADTNPFRYCGEYMDAESGLIYLRNRYYNPSIGRFISEDPAKSGLNWYGYCESNPIIMIDPNGLDSYIIYTYNTVSGDGQHTFYDEAVIRKQQLEADGRTNVHLFGVASAKDFERIWNTRVGYDMDGYDVPIEDVMIVAHGSIEGNKSDDTAQSYLFFDDGNGVRTKLYAKYNAGGDTDVAVPDLAWKQMNWLTFSACNTGNPDVYNLAYAFKIRMTVNNYIIAWDGGTIFNYNTGVLSMGPYDGWQKEIVRQHTWYKYVEKKWNGKPKRSRIGYRQIKG